jgi:hypothetical protein
MGQIQALRTTNTGENKSRARLDASRKEPAAATKAFTRKNQSVAANGAEPKLAATKNSAGRLPSAPKENTKIWATGALPRTKQNPREQGKSHILRMHKIR